MNNILVALGKNANLYFIGVPYNVYSTEFLYLFPIRITAISYEFQRIMFKNSQGKYKYINRLKINRDEKQTHKLLVTMDKKPFNSESKITGT